MINISNCNPNTMIKTKYMQFSQTVCFFHSKIITLTGQIMIKRNAYLSEQEERYLSRVETQRDITRNIKHQLILHLKQVTISQIQINFRHTHT